MKDGLYWLLSSTGVTGDAIVRNGKIVKTVPYFKKFLLGRDVTKLKEYKLKYLWIGEYPNRTTVR